MFEYDGFEYTFEEIKSAADAAGLSFDEYIAKHNITEKKKESAKISGVEQGATTPKELAPVTDFSSDLGFSGLPEVSNEITPIESIKNAFSNVYKDLGRVVDFWTGDSKVADFATAAIFNEALGDEAVEKIQQKYGKDAWVSKGIGLDEILDQRDDVRKELDKKQTIGLIESFEDGNIADIGAAAVSTVVNALGSVAYGIGTAATGFFFDYAAENYIDYNEKKAKRLGTTFEDVVLNNQDDTFAPVAIAGAQVAMERIGLGKIMKGFGKSASGAGAKVIDLLKVGGTEAATEINQHLLTKFNQRLAEDGDEVNALEKVFKNDFFTAETLETGLQGFVGGAGARGSGLAVSGVAKGIGTKDVKISPKVTMAVRTKEETDVINKAFDNILEATKMYSKSKDQDVKDAAEELIVENTSTLIEAIGKGREKAKSLSITEIKRIEDYTAQIESNYNNVARLKEKLDKGDISSEEFNLAVDRAKKIYDVTTKKIDQTVAIRQKLNAQVKAAKDVGIDVRLVQSEFEWNTMYPFAKRQSATEYTEGLYLLDSGNIVINKEIVEKNKSLGTIPHEVLHRILRASTAFKIDSDRNLVNEQQALGLVNGLESIIDKYDKKGVVRRNLESAYEINRDEKGKITGGNIEEYLTVFSEAIINGDIQVEQTMLQQIKQFVLDALRKVGLINYDFKSDDDLYNFLIDYSKTFAEQDKVSKRASNMLDKEFEKQAGVFASKKQEDLNARINDLVGPRNEDGSYNVTKEQYDNESIVDVYDKLIEGNYLHPLIVSRIEGNTVYGKPIENFIQDVKDKLVDTIMSFDPSKNDSLIGWINSHDC